MQRANLDIVLEESVHKHHGKSDIAKAIRESSEVGVVVPSILRTKLIDAGYAIIDDPKIMSDQYGFSEPKFLKRVLVIDKDDNLIAMGAAGDLGEALLHAMLGWFREHPSDALKEKMEAGIGVGLGVVANPKG